MAESKAARGLLRALVAGGSLPPLPPGVSAEEVAQTARSQGLSGPPPEGRGGRALLLGGPPGRGPRRGPAQRTRPHPRADRPRRPGPGASRDEGDPRPAPEGRPPRRDGVRRGVRPAHVRRGRAGPRALARGGRGLRGGGAHRVRSRRPRLGLHRPGLRRARGAAPQRELVPRPVSPRRRRGVGAEPPGRGQLPRRPATEDLLVHLALHAAFQHGLVLSLVQWLDFRRVLEREDVDPERLLASAAASRATVPLAAALLAAEAVVAAPPPPGPARRALRPRPRGLKEWLAPRLADPAGLRRPRDAGAGTRALGAHGRAAPRAPVAHGGRSPTTPRATARCPPGPPPPSGAPCAWAASSSTRPKGPTRPSTEAAGAPEVPFREELIRECLASFPWVRLTVTGQCMQPALADGEKVHLVASRRAPPPASVTWSSPGGGTACASTAWCGARPSPVRRRGGGRRPTVAACSTRPSTPPTFSARW